MNKRAFTIPEILIFMVIVGVICTLMMTIIKPNEKYYRYAYYNAYYVLSTAGFNIYQDALDKRDADITGTTYSAEDKEFPKTSTDLAKKLALASSDANTDEGYINTTFVKNENKVPKAVSADSFAKGKETFIATNSMRFFIAADDDGKPFVIQPINAITSGPTPVWFYIIWVDLNGNRGPNTPARTGNKKPDIVPFVMTTTGKVIPVGYPTIDTTYLSARVEYPTEATTSHSLIDTFYSTQKKTFGNYQYPTLDPLSLDFKDFVKNTVMETPTSSISQDTSCKVDAGNMTPCKVNVEEFKAF